MAKKKGHRSRSGGIGSMLKPLLIGAVAGYASKKFAPQVIPFQTPAVGAAAAFATGTRGAMGLLAGAAGAYGADMLTGGSASTGGSKLMLY